MGVIYGGWDRVLTALRSDTIIGCMGATSQKYVLKRCGAGFQAATMAASWTRSYAHASSALKFS